MIRFNTSHPRLGVKAGDYAKIQAFDLENQRLTLKVDGKEVFYWSPKNLEKSSSIEIYHQESREFSKGDTIVFKRNNEQLGIFNGDRASIAKIEKSTAEIILSNGSVICLNLTEQQNQHLDHGYALTTVVAQGKDVKWVIAYLEGPAPRLIKASQLKAGDITVLPKELQDKADNQYSKIVQVVKLKKSKSRVEISGKILKTDRVTLTLRDREGNVYTAHAHELKSNRKVKNASLLKIMCHSTWAYFPPFEQRKPHELPLSTSQQALLIDITRGDGLFLVVPYLNDLQKTLEAHGQLKRSALSYTDPEWKKLNEDVNRSVADIKGKVEEKIKNPHSQESNTSSPNYNLLKTEDIKSKAKTKNFPEDKKTNFIDIDAINCRLESDILGYATQWLGSPKKVSGYEARWSGALTVNIRGPKAGMWRRWSANRGGNDLISLYMDTFKLKWKEAINELAERLGLVAQQNYKSREIQFKKVEKNKEIEKDLQERIKEAKKLYNKGVPIAGTIAEKYLREYRGITGELPNDFRFLKSDFHLNTKKNVPALVAPYRDKEGKMVGIVRIYLNKDGSKYTDTFIDDQGRQKEATTKANRGISSHGRVVIQEAVIPKVLWVAEGVETALSVAKAVPDQTVVASLAVGQIKNVPISSETQEVIICADNDPASSQSKESISQAVESFLSKGVRVFIALPPEIPAGMKKHDFNDLLKSGGIGAVQKSLNNLVEISDPKVFKTDEPRLQNDLNRLRSEADAVRKISRESQQPTLSQSQSVHKSNDLEKGFER